MVFVATLVLTASFAPVLLADDIDDEYLRRSRALSADDVKGHLTLAKWCRANERWNLVADECNAVLLVDSNNQIAALLLDQARKMLNHSIRGETPPKGSVPVASGKIPRIVNDDEIQRIRRAELFKTGKERARIRVDQRQAREFIQSMSRNRGFPVTENEFHRLPQLEKARLILQHGRDRYADAVRISTDPDRVRVFDREVMSTIASGCATVECHGGAGPSKFQIYGGRSIRGAKMYTNFLILQQYEVGPQRLIDRLTPADSLVLTYGLPPQPGREALNHPTKIDPIFLNTKDRKYQKILDWIKMLDFDTPDYDVQLDAPPTTR